MAHVARIRFRPVRVLRFFSESSALPSRRAHGIRLFSRRIFRQAGWFTQGLRHPVERRGKLAHLEISQFAGARADSPSGDRTAAAFRRRTGCAILRQEARRAEKRGARPKRITSVVVRLFFFNPSMNSLSEPYGDDPVKISRRAGILCEDSSVPPLSKAISPSVSKPFFSSSLAMKRAAPLISACTLSAACRRRAYPHS